MPDLGICELEVFVVDFGLVCFIGVELLGFLGNVLFFFLFKWERADRERRIRDEDLLGGNWIISHLIGNDCPCDAFKQ